MKAGEIFECCMTAPSDGCEACDPCKELGLPRQILSYGHCMPKDWYLTLVVHAHWCAEMDARIWLNKVAKHTEAFESTWRLGEKEAVIRLAVELGLLERKEE